MLPDTAACSISQIKKGCFLLNVSRGGLVERSVLISGLESQQLGGVGMAVSGVFGAVAEVLRSHSCG
jgi:phosphoglycerate dehydrogenase-like enzyme